MKSRPERWQEAVQLVRTGLEHLIELQSEYQEWLDNLPENLQDSPTAEKLGEITELDIESLVDSLDEAAFVELPKGFGRD